MARVKSNAAPPHTPATDATKPKVSDDELVEALKAFDAPPLRTPPASPVNIKPRMGAGFDRLVTTIIDESIDVVAEYDYLEKELTILEALTPEIVRDRINSVEKNAWRAHRLFVLAKVQLDRYRIDADAALSSMRDEAVAQLTEEKLTGKRTKQVTDADVRERVASIHPDEWREISDGLAKAEGFLKSLERFADVWYRRSWSLSSLNG